MMIGCGVHHYYPMITTKKIYIPFAFSNSPIKGKTALHPNHRSRAGMKNARRTVKSEKPKSCVLHIKRAEQMRKRRAGDTV